MTGHQTLVGKDFQQHGLKNNIKKREIIEGLVLCPVEVERKTAYTCLSIFSGNSDIIKKENCGHANDENTSPVQKMVDKLAPGVWVMNSKETLD